MPLRTVFPFAFLSCVLLATAAAAQPIAFTRIADATTPGPGWAEPLGFSAPAADAGRVVFHVYENLVARQGVYLAHAGTVSVIADSSTLAPGGNSNFFSFHASPAVSGDDVAFVATDAGGFPSVHARLGGSLVTLAEWATPEPGTGDPLNIDSRGPALDGANAVFRAYDGGGWPGAYVSIDGTLVTAADENTVLPGSSGDAYLNLSRPAIDGASVAFRATAPDASGLYVVTDGNVRAVFDDNVSLPGSAAIGGFIEGGPSFRGGTIAFSGGSLDRIGIYAEMGGVLRVVADDTTPIPNSSETFAWFGGPSTGYTAADGTTVAFIAGPAIGPSGLYALNAGALHTVLTDDDALDGKEIRTIEIGPDAVDGNRIAFLVSFDDSTYAIYVAALASSVPALSVPTESLLAVLLGVLAVSRLRRPRET